MFEFIHDPDERGQVGIGTLIVFIAMVLVAAIAAGVLINTAGFLQTKSQATGEESAAQVSNRVQVIDAFGNVNSASDNITDGTIDYVNVSVMRAAGADNINLSRSTIQWIGPSQAVTLTHNGTAATDDNLGATTFITKNVDTAGSAPDKVLSDDDTRIVISMYAPDIINGSDINESAVSADSQPGLTEGQQVSLTITTQYGSQTPYQINVPESLEGKQAVSL
ncbi:MAG: archaellin/type IV pilin N-terminal domain-containing protein [Halanaeroarchaeum sp.]